MNKFSKLWLLFLIGISACKDASKEKPDAVESLQTTIDKVKLISFTGQSIDMKQYKGKAVFINFWATWCKPCLEEMPSIAKAQRILENENVTFLMVSAESIEEIEMFRTNHDYKFNYARVENSEELNILALPTTFIFNPHGELIFSEMGSRKWDGKTNIDLILKIAKPK